MVPNCNQSLTVLVGACAARPPACGNATPNSPQRKIVPLFCAKMLCDCFKRKRVFLFFLGPKTLFLSFLAHFLDLFGPFSSHFMDSLQKGIGYPPNSQLTFLAKIWFAKGEAYPPYTPVPQTSI